MPQGGEFDDNITHHEFISQYVDALSESLSVWDNNRNSKDYYNRLAWGGLEKSTSYKNLSEEKKGQIQKTINNEATGSNAAQGEKCD